MVRTEFTLAALAVAAAPDLNLHGVADFPADTEEIGRSALVTDATGEVHLVLSPDGPTQTAQLAAEVRALRALSDGLRSLLPFTIPLPERSMNQGSTQVEVMRFVPGQALSSAEWRERDGVAEALGVAIAAIHGLPAAFLTDAGISRDLTVAPDTLAPTNLIRESIETSRIPPIVADHWSSASADERLWEYSPCVIHGGVDHESVYFDGSAVAAMLNWRRMREGDPAVDLRFVASVLPSSKFRALMASYEAARGTRNDSYLAKRANLLADLEVARWLLHGIETADAEIVSDAESMLQQLAARLARKSGDADGHAVSPELGAVTGEASVSMLVDSVDTDETDAKRLTKEAPTWAPGREADAFSQLTDSYNFPPGSLDPDEDGDLGPEGHDEVRPDGKSDRSTGPGPSGPVAD